MEDLGNVFERYYLVSRTTADVHMHATCCAIVHQLICGYFAGNVISVHPNTNFFLFHMLFLLKTIINKRMKLKMVMYILYSFVYVNFN